MAKTAKKISMIPAKVLIQFQSGIVMENNRNRKHITENEQKKVDIEKAKST